MQLSDTDSTLEALGSPAADVSALIERYTGKRRLDLQEADALLNALWGGTPVASARVVITPAPPKAAPASPVGGRYAADLVDSIPSPPASLRAAPKVADDDSIPPPAVPTFRTRTQDEAESSAAPVQHVQAEERTAEYVVEAAAPPPALSDARAAAQRFDLDSDLPPQLVASNVRSGAAPRPPSRDLRPGSPQPKPAKFVAGLPGAEDLPELTPARPAAPLAAAQTEADDEDSFEILVDEEILEIEPDDLIDDTDSDG